MATKNTGKTGKAQRLKSAARKSEAAHKAAAELSAKEAAALKALDAKHAAPPDFSVKTILDEAKELAANARTKASDLVEGSMLKKGFDTQLQSARDVLDRAEKIWTASRTRTAPQRLKLARAEGEELKRETMAALRYFLKDDTEVQKRVDEIAEGTGDDDTVSDLRKLAVLAAEHSAALKKAKKLPAKLTAALTKAADALSMAAAEGTEDKAEAAHESESIFDLRNRAYWALKNQMDDVRDAGKYVFRGDKKALKHFKSSHANERARAGKSEKDAGALPGEPTKT